MNAWEILDAISERKRCGERYYEFLGTGPLAWEYMGFQPGRAVHSGPTLRMRSTTSRGAGLSDRPECGLRPLGSVHRAMRKARLRRSVRAEKHFVISMLRTVLGAKVIVTSALSAIPSWAGLESLAQSKPSLPGQQGSRPGICVKANPR